MNKSALLLLALALTGCKCAQKNNVAQSAAKPLQEAPCPSKGTCKTELLRNKSIDIVMDDFGKKYYKIVESRETHVVRYEFNQGNEETMPDSGYREEVIFEIGSAGQALDFTGIDLQQTKMLYGRFCFCPRDQVGYFAVENGALAISGKEEISVSLEFEMPGIPHLTKQIRTSLK